MSTINLVGFEDLPGPLSPNGSDRDFNDIEINTWGISFHTLGAYNYVPQVPYPNEIPFLSGFYSDYGVVVDPVVQFSVNSSQSAYSDVVLFNVNNAGWQVLQPSGIQDVSAFAHIGDRVDFLLETPVSSYTAIPSLNLDGLAHMVVAVNSTPVPEVPEASSMGMLAIGLGLILAGRFFKKYFRKVLTS